MILSFIWVVIGFILLVKGADFLVDGSSNIAKKFHIPEIIIGLTIISIGTSLPELLISVKSALKGYSDMTIGNIVGSNISNLLLILGVSSIIRPIHLKKETRLIEIPLCLVIAIVFMIICNIGQGLTRIEGTFLISLFALFIIYAIFMSFKGEEFDREDGVEEVEEKRNINTFKDIFFIVVGIIALKIGGDLTVDNAVNIAKIFNLSEKVISVTILAFGTSLPELVTGVEAALKNKSDIAIGNILGSCIFNMLLIIGVSSAISPISYNLSYNKDLIILIFSILLLLIFAIFPRKNKMTRTNGIIYFGMYIAYVVSLFVT